MDNEKSSLKLAKKSQWLDLLNRLQKNPELWIGLILAIPIVLLYLYGLSTLSGKATWLIGTVVTILFSLLEQ